MKELGDLALYEFIYKKLYTFGYTFDQVSESLQLGLNRKSMQKKYSRLCKKLGLPYRPPQKVPTVSINSPKPKTLVSIQKPTNTQTLGGPSPKKKIKYGDLPPTGFISDLNHDDWFDKYVPITFKETYVNTRGKKRQRRILDEKRIEQMKKLWRLPYLTEFRDLIWDEEELLALLPRKYGKTESIIALFVRWFAEIYLPLLIVSPSDGHSKKILKRMKHIIKSEAFRADYGDIAGNFTMTAGNMEIVYVESMGWSEFDSPVSFCTFNTGKEGIHPAWIHFEDVMQKDFKNMESNDDIKRTFSKTYLGMLSDGCKSTFTGTRYGMEDFYNYLDVELGYPVFHKRALNEERTKWLYNPSFSLEWLQKDYKKNPAVFETTRNNNPVPSEGLYFSIDNWEETDVMPLRSMGTEFYVVVDPARGQSKGADNTAILVIGVYLGTGIVVDGFIGHLSTDWIVRKVNEFYAKYNPAFTLVENIFHQIDIGKFSHIRGLVPYADTTRGAKIVRINAMKSYFVESLLKVMKGIQPQSFLKNEYLQYNEQPSNTSRHDDAIDALSIFVQMYGHLLNRVNIVEDNSALNEIPSFLLTSDGWASS